ncbi:hypothetical protein TrRE_jg13540 [Triparma retinervis]|uniref:Cyclin-like domain-containing protein n=1 Tax=Triparma retinervis TaxID=2557542 RepID=A0A9W7CEC4_9STRA|nr:hypothetical protein TrRE_jg13540 [Triparma retinervis]
MSNLVHHHLIQERWIDPLNEDPNSLPSVASGEMTVEVEARERGEGLQFILYLGKVLNLPRLTWSTALVFYHRFYSRQSFNSHDKLETAIACLFLACKVEETPKKIQQAKSELRDLARTGTGSEEADDYVPMDPKGSNFLLMKDRVLLLERIVLHTLSFDLNITHPYQSLMDEMKKLASNALVRGLYNNAVDEKGSPDPQKVFPQLIFQIATGLVNDSYLTRVCTCVTHEVVAKTAIMIALESVGAQPFKGRTWMQILGLEKRNGEVARFVDMLGERAKGVNLLLSYSDDPLGDIIATINVPILGATIAGIAAVGLSFARLLPSLGAEAFVLTPEEEAACVSVSNAFDSADWEKEEVEEGTKGYINRRRQANEAKEKYQEGKTAREVKDRSLRYSETNLDFLCVLLRAVEPQRGEVLIDLGSGCGRTTLGAAALFPALGKATGIEFLPELVKLSNGYRGKVRGRKASTEFINGDFTDPVVQSKYLPKADIIFATASFFNKGEVERAIEENVKVGARVITVDERLRSKSFKLIEEVVDGAGDLQLNNGYVYEKVA